MSEKLQTDNSEQPSWLWPRLQGLSFHFTGEFYKDSPWLYRGEPLTREEFTRIIEYEGGVVLPDLQDKPNYVIRLGHLYPASLDKTVRELNKSLVSRIGILPVIDFFRDMLFPSRIECIDMLKSGKRGVARFMELVEYHPAGCVDLRGIDMRGLDLENIRFNAGHSVLSSVDFRDANLAGAKIAQSDHLRLDGADLSKAWIQRLVDSSLQRANLTGGTFSFERCNLDNVNLAGAEIKLCGGCSLRNANLEGCTWNVWQKPMTNDFSGASFRNSRIAYADFHQSSFRGADLRNAEFRHDINLADTDFREANCRGALFGYANFSNAQVAGADFTGATLRMVDTTGVDIASAIGLSEAIVLPRGSIGPHVRKLESICADSKRVTFQGCASNSNFTSTNEVRVSLSSASGGLLTKRPTTERRKERISCPGSPRPSTHHTSWILPDSGLMRQWIGSPSKCPATTHR